MTRPPQSSPRPPKVDDRDPDETLESLVAGVFGGKPQRPNPDDTILVPPEPPAKTAPPPERPAAPPAAPPVARAAPSPAQAAPPPAVAAAEEPPPPAAAPRPERPRRSLLQRLQVSPAVIVASIIAGATGAAADAWFDDVAAFLSELTTGAEHPAASPEADLMPVGIAPSSFSEEAEAAQQGGDATATESAGPAPDAPSPPPGSEPALTTEEPAAAEAAAAPADRIRVITWDESSTGTVVTFWGNGGFLPERVVHFRIDGERPRELVKLRGIDLPFPQSVLDLGTPEVNRIRTGFHPQDRVNELHVVLDLAGPGVAIERIETGRDSLRVHLRRAASGTP